MEMLVAEHFVRVHRKYEGGFLFFSGVNKS
jgi:hypothetical protein